MNEETKDTRMLPVVAYRYTSGARIGGKWHYQESFPKWDDRKVSEVGQLEELCRLTDAQSLATDLRLELNAKRLKLCAALKERNDAQARLAEKDARIAELAAHARGKNKALANALAEVERLRGELEHAEQWRELALQFDRHRMNAMALIKAVAHGFAGAPECEVFAAVPPIPGHEITAEITKLRAQLEQLQSAPAERGGVVLKIGKRLAELLDEDQWAEIEPLLARLNPAPATADSDVREVSE